METNISTGVFCPKCNTTYGTIVNVGGNANCPECNSKLIPAPKEAQARTIANFKCKHCACQIGLLTVIGATATCPGCGKAI